MLVELFVKFKYLATFRYLSKDIYLVSQCLFSEPFYEVQVVIQRQISLSLTVKEVYISDFVYYM